MQGLFIQLVACSSKGVSRRYQRRPVYGFIEIISVRTYRTCVAYRSISEFRRGYKRRCIIRGLDVIDSNKPKCSRFVQMHCVWYIVVGIRRCVTVIHRRASERIMGLRWRRTPAALPMKYLELELTSCGYRFQLVCEFCFICGYSVYNVKYSRYCFSNE